MAPKVKITIKLDPDDAARLKALAGGHITEWVRRQLAAAATPAPDPPVAAADPDAASSGAAYGAWRAGFDAGWDLGLGFARLRQAFTLGDPAQDVDRAGLKAWAAAHPALWARLLEAILQEPWAGMFAQWWQPSVDSAAPDQPPMPPNPATAPPLAAMPSG